MLCPDCDSPDVSIMPDDLYDGEPQILDYVCGNCGSQWSDEDA
jgi:hypothetical protein